MYISATCHSNCCTYQEPKRYRHFTRRKCSIAKLGLGMILFLEFIQRTFVERKTKGSKVVTYSRGAITITCLCSSIRGLSAKCVLCILRYTRSMDCTQNPKIVAKVRIDDLRSVTYGLHKSILWVQYIYI